ncbi:hypothetical protein B0H10DRAFT_1218527 [Mycena sp. CBHHK59/15]|nr:hypothetical protein B0H10DRAFT_1218527 [Mycena sp. CBHHK59/15]
MHSSLESTPTLGNSSFDRSQIRRLINDSESSILSIDSQIGDLHSQIRDLQCLRAKEHTRIMLLMAPVHALPAELLVEIFRFSLAVHPIMVPRPKRIIPLTQVCHYWRQVAHSTPRFWVKCEALLNATPSDTYVAGMKAWLEYSAQLPLSVSLKSQSMDTDLTVVLNTLLPFAPRIASLHLWLPFYSAIDPLFANPLHSLEELSLGAGVSQGRQIDLRTIAPRLRTFVTYGDYPRIFAMPWSQLTSIDYGDTPGNCLDVLLKCHTLEEASFRTWCWDFDDLPHQPAVSLLHLRVLNLSIDYDDPVGQIIPFFRPLALPALTSLQLSMAELSWPSEEFSRFLLRAPNIQSFDLNCCKIDSEGLITALRSCPALKSLQLTCCPHCIDDNLLRALRYRESDTDPLVPLLENLQWFDIDKNFDESSLVDMIRSRWWPLGSVPFPNVARLKKVTVNCGDPHLSQEFRARIQDCVDGGLVYSERYSLDLFP